MSSRRVRALALAAAALLATTALAACGKDDDKAAAGDGGEAPTLRLGYFPNITHAPALIGVNKGFFQESLGSTKLEGKPFNAGPAAI